MSVEFSNWVPNKRVSECEADKRVGELERRTDGHADKVF